jgi:hypothetical protein
VPTEPIRMDFLIMRIDQIGLTPEISTDDQPACVMDVVAQDGTKLTIGLTYGALSTLIDALITNSPGTPGTPGRN